MPHNFTFLPADENGQPIHHKFNQGACVGPCEIFNEAVEEFNNRKNRQIEPCSLTQADFVAWQVIGAQYGDFFYFKWK